MHRTAGSSSSNGGIFKGTSIFGGTSTRPTTRPNTSNGSPVTYSESNSNSNSSSTTSRTSGFSRKASFSSNSTSTRTYSQRGRSNSSGITNFSPERREPSKHTDTHPLPAVKALPRLDTSFQYKKDTAPSSAAVFSPASADSYTSTTPYSNMLQQRPGTAGTGYSVGAPISATGPQAFAIQPPSPTLETITYQHIQETSSKRISTLDYLRKANEGRVYWFNTLLFNKPDLQRMPYFDARKLARRATNYLLLGISLPTIIDLNGSNALEFLKTLNALLSEFETFQQIHPPDGSSSLSRGRFPQMFKRAATTSKGRRTSSAADIGLPMGNDQDSRLSNGSISAGGGNSAASFGVGENDLLPGEEYTHLLTPSLPFDPDFYETFATLCDVLIDCYTKLMSLVSSPKDCNPVVAEMFTKADARVRKIIVQGVVKEFEDSSRGGVKCEVAGVGRVVLGGLI